MSKHLSKAGVGLFVVCGIFLLVLGIVQLGGSNLASKDISFTLHFPNSVNGLSSGAPVYYLGVQIGQVSDIALKPHPTEKHASIIAVTLQFHGEVFSDWDDSPVTAEEAYKKAQYFIDGGLCAHLSLASFVTGQFRVELEMRPKDRAKFFTLNTPHEIPTIESDLDSLSKALKTLPLHEMATDLRSTLQSVSDILENGKIEETLNGVNTIVNTLSESLDKEDLRVSVKNLRLTSEESLKICKRLNAMLDDLPHTLKHIDSAAESASDTMRGTAAMVRDDSPFMRKMQTTVQEFGAAARALRELAQTLQRNPEALLLGKGNKK